ncbi:uncharacterized protein LOC111028402, partial [Myzus persicae]|uniref:uncharacterized protein LOC111028402 n=1 Tax=Myzus persicae TaxID=13164 RepID=UPI000B931C49
LIFKPTTQNWNCRTTHPRKNNHDCNNIKQKAEQEIANLKLEIEKLNLRKNNMDLLLNYFNSKNTKKSSKGVKLDDDSKVMQITIYCN